MTRHSSLPNVNKNLYLVKSDEIKNIENLKSEVCYHTRVSYINLIFTTSEQLVCKKYFLFLRFHDSFYIFLCYFILV